MYKVCSSQSVRFNGFDILCSFCLVTACSIGLVCEHAVSFDQFFGECKVKGSNTLPTTSHIHSVYIQVQSDWMLKHLESRLEERDRQQRNQDVQNILPLLYCCCSPNALTKNKPALSTELKAAIVHKQHYQEQREYEYIL